MENHPYFDPSSSYNGQERDAAGQAHAAASILGQDYVNQQLLDAARYGALAEQEAARQAEAEAMFVIDMHHRGQWSEPAPSPTASAPGLIVPKSFVRSDTPAPAPSAPTPPPAIGVSPTVTAPAPKDWHEGMFFRFIVGLASVYCILGLIPLCAVLLVQLMGTSSAPAAIPFEVLWVGAFYLMKKYN